MFLMMNNEKRNTNDPIILIVVFLTGFSIALK